MGGNRLKEVRKMLRLTQTELGVKLDIPWSRVKDMESGKQKISPEFASLMEDIFSISGWWLLTGKGQMQILVDNYNNNIPTISSNHLTGEQLDFVSLNYYPDVVAAAGYGAIVDFEVYPCQKMKLDRYFLEEFLNIRRFNTVDIIRVVGDSMEPFIKDGEVVLIERHSEAKNGETVIANINGHIYIKKFYSDPFGKWVKLVSNNGSYNDINVEEEQLQYLNIVGVVRAKIKAF